jgi:hypothetical protein
VHAKGSFPTTERVVDAKPRNGSVMQNVLDLGAQVRNMMSRLRMGERDGRACTHDEDELGKDV